MCRSVCCLVLLFVRNDLIVPFRAEGMYVNYYHECHSIYHHICMHAYLFSSIRPSVPVFLFLFSFRIFFRCILILLFRCRRGPIQHHILHAQSRQSSVACMRVSYCTVQYSTVWLWLHYHGLCLCVPAQFFTISVWCILFVPCTEREISICGYMHTIR